MPIQFKKCMQYVLNLFNKQSQTDNVNIIHLNSTIKLPSKSKLNEQELESYNTYKRTYAKIVKRSSTLNPKDLESIEFQQSLNMYIDLLLCLFDEDLELRNTSNTIKLLKMNLYLVDIAKLETEALLRLKALKEVYRKSLFISERNKSTIANEISILENDYLIFKSQKEHGAKEIENYKSLLITNSKESHINVGLEELSTLALQVSKEETENIIASNISIEGKIAFLEKLLEIYAFKNKDKLKDLNFRLNKLSGAEVTKLNKDNLLEKILKLEKLYKIYYYFGKKLVSEEEIYKLYELKLYLLSFDMFSNWHDEIKNCEGIEAKCYQKILSTILQNIMTGTNPYMESQFGEDMNLAIKHIGKQCRNSKGKFDFEELLKDRIKTIFLLQCEKEFGLRKFFQKLIPYDLRLELEVPINTFVGKREHFMKYHIELYHIYNLIKKNNLVSSKYALPEGIIEVENDLPKGMLSHFRENLKNKKEIIFPKSLRLLTCNIFTDIKDPIRLFYINNGFEKGICYDGPMDRLNVHTLSIPSSLEYFSEDFIDFSQVKTLIIRNPMLGNNFLIEVFFDRYAISYALKNILHYCFKENDALNKYLKATNPHYEDFFNLNEICFTYGNVHGYVVQLTKFDIIQVLTDYRSDILECIHDDSEIDYITKELLLIAMEKENDLHKRIKFSKTRK